MTRTGLFAAGLLATSMMVAPVAAAQTLSADKKLTVTLDDGVDITLYGEARSFGSANRYYYLPPVLTNSTNEAGSPEFMFLQYITDETEEEGGTSGGLIHFLVEWGLSPDQKDDLSDILENEHNAELGGAITMLPSSKDGPSFYIVSGTLGNDGTMNNRLVTSGEASLVPGGKAAVAAKLDGNSAQVLAATFDPESNITDISTVMNMEYALQVQGVKGRVVIDWSKIAVDSETLTMDYTRELTGKRKKTKCFIVWCRDKTLKDYVYTYDEVQSQFGFLQENEYIDFDFEQGDIPEEVAAPIREAFIQYFISAVTEASAPTPEPSRTSEEEEEEPINVRQGAGYTFNSTKVSTMIQQGTQSLDLDVKLSVRYPYTIVGNLKSWYTLASADPYAVRQVFLNDPFFDRRDLLFVIDGNIEEIFEDEVNMVTVEIEKDRPGTVPFTDSVTFTRQNIQESGNLATVTYARGADTGPNSGTYKFKTKWSMRGGDTWSDPEAGWNVGNWEGVTLNAPIAAREIELEGDLEELEAAGFTRVTAQIQYPKLGKMKQENISLSVAKGEPLASETIFMDSESPGYVYRLLLNHKRLGQLALPWSRQDSSDYIYASIPGEFLDDIINDVVSDIVSVAQGAVSGESGDQLNRFDILLGGN